MTDVHIWRQELEPGDLELLEKRFFRTEDFDLQYDSDTEHGAHSSDGRSSREQTDLRAFADLATLGEKVFQRACKSLGQGRGLMKQVPSRSKDEQRDLSPMGLLVVSLIPFGCCSGRGHGASDWG